MGWKTDRKKTISPIIISSELWKRLGLKLMVQNTLYQCDINYFELENILEKLEELKFIKSFFLVDDEIGGSGKFFKLVPEKNFNKLYEQFAVDKILNPISAPVVLSREDVFPKAVISKLPVLRN